MPAAGEVRRDQEYESDSGLLIAAVLLFSNLALCYAQLVACAGSGRRGQMDRACSWAPPFLA